MANLTKWFFPTDAVERATESARKWMEDHDDGFPRSLAQDLSKFDLWIDGFEAPTICGYEELQRKGLVTRIGVISRNREERVHFRITDAGRQALSEGEKNG